MIQQFFPVVGKEVSRLFEFVFNNFQKGRFFNRCSRRKFFRIKIIQQAVSGDI